MPHRTISFLILLLLLAACLPQPAPGTLTPWVYVDLRHVDEAGGLEGAPPPGQDLIAVYSRTLASELQFRLDLLDLTHRRDADLYLALDTGPGGAQGLPVDLQTEIAWDTLLVIPASGPIQALAQDGTQRQNLAVRVLSDLAADTIEISLTRAALQGVGLSLHFQVILAPPGTTSPVDSTPPLALDGPPPPQAHVLLAFWNTLPAFTPAQALRRWDGAHTGPFGGRHGLHNLLRVARNRSLPLALLDLKTPASLSALSYIGGTDLVRDMAAEGLLILPDSVPSLWPSPAPILEQGAWSRAAGESREGSSLYKLPDSPFLFAPLPGEMTPGQAQRGYRVIFAPRLSITGPSSGLAPVQRWGEQRVISIFPSPAAAGLSEQEMGQQFSLEQRRALVGAAQSSQERFRSPGILVLGGDLPQTAWGDPNFARAAFDWLAAHPWIQVLDAQDLLAAETSGGFDLQERQAGGDRSEGISLDELAREIEKTPPGQITDAAWQAFLALFYAAYPNPPELPALRAQYAGQVGVLLSAARWAASPHPFADCSQDPDLDGQPECVLASEQVYALFETGPGALTYAFAFSKTGVHQIIGPSSQFASGTSDPETWDLLGGLAADPAVYPGAFFDNRGPYQAALDGGRLIFSPHESGYTKLFTLLPNGIRVEIQAHSPLNIQVPLALDPWVRFSPGWADRYSGQLNGNTWTWKLAGGPQVLVTSSAHLSPISFIDSRDRMDRVEDPNSEPPAGHFLPFPLSLVEIYAAGNTMIEIRLIP